jgi:hypothetical protein
MTKGVVVMEDIPVGLKDLQNGGLGDEDREQTFKIIKAFKQMMKPNPRNEVILNGFLKRFPRWAQKMRSAGLVTAKDWWSVLEAEKTVHSTPARPNASPGGVTLSGSPNPQQMADTKVLQATVTEQGAEIAKLKALVQSLLQKKQREIVPDLLNVLNF